VGISSEPAPTPSIHCSLRAVIGGVASSAYGWGPGYGYYKEKRLQGWRAASVRDSAANVVVRGLKHVCRAITVRKRIVTDQVGASDPVGPMSRDTGVPVPGGHALAAAARDELGRSGVLRQNPNC